MLKKTLAITAVLATTWLAGPLAAQTTDFPNKPVRIVVPFPPGGATDITARVVAEKLSTKWGQPVVIDNKAGAGGNVGSDLVAKSAPDGHNIVLGVTGSHAINISLYKKMPYHPLNDFEPLTQATIYPNAIVVNPQVPANSLPELIALLKKEPGKFSYGSDGNGTASHLGMEVLKAKANVQLTHIPYKGSTPMITDLLGGTLMVGVTGLPAVQQHLKAGKLKMIAITTLQRAPGTPDYKTVAEQGFANFNAAPWAGFFAPKGTPKPVVDKLAQDLADALKQPDVVQKMNELGSTVVGNKPDEFRQFVTRQIEMWAEGVKISGAMVD
ncbi:tripartite tricarboxylate transporter substrate binding protein [Limnohabitans sp. 15K]|uniref:Bug family tripartite tricarboxylate transporter substrate binding protein n=1 Tax=Limnohabitans sp. 15K TaxID=1100706 RepID=UPI000C1E4FAE|nr:tripartite tricarboxylate transporter substrate binding protein [Limnohabitans sp. 15K]PIT83650.1 LacI family transcriptional regulator [Limnohabitans sp. 15K]